MDLIYLSAVFISIFAIISFRKPLYLALMVAIALLVILFRIPIADCGPIIYKGIFSNVTFTVISAFYTITFLQRMLEKRKRLLIAEESISKIFNSRRINATLVPFIIGLLPSAGAMLIAAPIVRKAAGNDLDLEEQTFVTTYFRHISEAFVPTYSSIILAIKLSGQSVGGFVLGMLPMVVVLFYLGYIQYVRKIPKLEASKEYVDKRGEWIKVAQSMWSILLSVLLILFFNLPIAYVVIGVIILNFFIDKFTIKEILPMFKSAFETKLIVSTVFIMIFKEALNYTGVILALPEYFKYLPVQPELIYAAMFLVGTLLVGTQAIIAIVIPLAYATLPNAGLGLLIMLMSMSYIAMQISPTHICLTIATEEFGVGFPSLVKKTFPIFISFLIISTIYGYFLINVLKI